MFVNSKIRCNFALTKQETKTHNTMNTEKKIRIELTAKELNEIYMALNAHGIQYHDKSESLKTNDPEIITFHPDYYQEKWMWIGSLKSKIYKAEKRLEKKNA